MPVSDKFICHALNVIRWFKFGRGVAVCEPTGQTTDPTMYGAYYFRRASDFKLFAILLLSYADGVITCRLTKFSPGSGQLPVSALTQIKDKDGGHIFGVSADLMPLQKILEEIKSFGQNA